MKTILTLTGITIGFIGALCMNQSSGAELQGVELEPIQACPPCPACKINADRIIRDNPMIDMTHYNPNSTIKVPDKEGIEIQIGDDIWTKEELEVIKLEREK